MILLMFPLGLLGCGATARGNGEADAAAGNGGSGSTGGSAGSPGTGGATSACNPACTGTKPVCIESSKTCVQCTSNAQCSGTATPLCDTAKNTCAACLAATDCPSATAASCVSGACAVCTSNTDCTHISGKGICSSGTCVTCTPGNESACSGNSCNPKTNTCTTTPVGTIDVCHPCQADSECIGGNAPGSITARCVAMTFTGAAHGNYCLQRVSAGCSNPYKVPINSTSISGVPAEDYCGINQTATTCEAVLDLIASKVCAADTDCGGGSGGLCKTVGVDPNRCTIPCDSAAQCLASAPGNICTPPNTPYCH